MWYNEKMIPRTPILQRRVSAFYLEGLSTRDTGLQLGISFATVRTILREMGITLRGTGRRKGQPGKVIQRKSTRRKLLLKWVDGYAFIWQPGYHRQRFNIWAKRADLVLEKKLGRLLLPNEIAHHKNLNRADDRPKNLEAMTVSEHQSHHVRERHTLKLEKFSVK